MKKPQVNPYTQKIPSICSQCPPCGYEKNYDPSRLYLDRSSCQTECQNYKRATLDEVTGSGDSD